MQKRKFVLIFLILAVGFFLRVYDINHAPPGVYPDESVNGIDAMNALEKGEWQWFYPANNGREGLFMNIIAVMFYLFGVSPLTLKLPAILFGTLTILGTYLIARELFNRRVGLISAWLVATGFWAINFSRISFRANMLPFVLVFSFYFLWRGMRDRKYSSFIWGGLFFGLGLHTYIAFRIAPLILLVMLPVFFLTRKNFFKDYWLRLITFCVFAFLAAAPMLHTFFIAHPEYWQSRSSEISILSPSVNQGHLLRTFGRSFGLALVKYNVWGDQNWRHNYPPYALLDPITGVAFTFGLVFSVLKILHLLSVRFFREEKHDAEDFKKHARDFEIYIFLLAWFFSMLVPEFMTAEGNPHALRSIGTLPVAFIFAAITFNYFWHRANKHGLIFKKTVVLIMVFSFFLIGVFNSIKYHVYWAKNRRTAESFDQNLMDTSDYIKTLPVIREKIIFAESMQRIPIQLFNWDMPNVEYYYLGQAEEVEPKKPNNFEIILTEYNDETITILQDKFPELKMEEKKDDLGMSFWILK
jgi:4-amino-4-deoxy-L-arabinose transferase-like glycosyltransferase